MRQNQQLDHQYLLDQLVSGNLTVSEKADLQNYIHDSFHDKELDALMQSHWKSLNSNELKSDETQLLILKNRILLKLKQSTFTPEAKSVLFSGRLSNYLMRVAAVLFLPLMLGTAYTFHRMNLQSELLSAYSQQERVVANPGSRVHFVLPDQTEVWLNSGSTLEFPFLLHQNDKRIVKLTGQGYFKVSHDASRPFLVETDGLIVKALGTSFDVSNYAEDNQICSTLESGSVALMGLDGSEATRLTPGQKAILDKQTGIVSIKNIDTQLFTSWKDGKLIFRNTPLAEVTQQMERWFNCKIQVDPRLTNLGLVYTATIQDETLGEVLKMIEISTSVITKIEKREVFIEVKN